MAAAAYIQATSEGFKRCQREKQRKGRFEDLEKERNDSAEGGVGGWACGDTKGVPQPSAQPHPDTEVHISGITWSGVLAFCLFYVLIKGVQICEQTGQVLYFSGVLSRQINGGAF